MYLTSVSDFNDPTNQNVQQFGQISIKSIEAWGPVVGGFEVRLKDDAMVMVVGTDTAHLGMSQHGMNCEDCRKHDERINPKVEIDSSARQLPKVDYGMLAFPLPFDAIATECGYGLSWDNVPDILEYDSMMHEDELANPTIVASLEDMESWFARPEQKIWVETKEGERKHL